MADYVFKRYEMKYILDQKQYLAVKKAIENRLYPDEYGKNTVQSLYYDTPDDRLVRTSIEKPTFKEKLRARCYNLNDCDKDVYLEMKRKSEGVVYKRRIALKENELGDFQTERFRKTQIGKELNYFFDFYGNLRPKILILYDREAFFEKDGDLRVTFDQNIRYRTRDLNFHSSLRGELLLPSDKTLMELKSGSALPLWLCEILSDEQITKQSFSKYGAAYEREYYKKLHERSKIICLNRYSRAEAQPLSASSSL